MNDGGDIWLWKIGVAKLMEDYDIASEVYSQPSVYGLTYAAHRVLFFDFKAAGIRKFVNF